MRYGYRLTHPTSDLAIGQWYASPIGLDTNRDTNVTESNDIDEDEPEELNEGDPERVAMLSGPILKKLGRHRGVG